MIIYKQIQNKKSQKKIQLANKTRMGTILTKIIQNRKTIMSSISAISIFYYIITDYLQKKSFRNKIIEELKNQKKLFKSKSIDNQIYLQNQNIKCQLIQTLKHPIYKIAVTGGPCGGKTSSFNRIKEVFGNKGFQMFSVPQINTLIYVSGATDLIPKLTSTQLIEYQAMIIKFQMYFEDYIMRLAQMSNHPAIILCDRGTVDAHAYLSADSFQAVLDQQGWNLTSLRDKRYDLVCFLSSAANGAEQFYTNQNNAARSEKLEDARELDKKTLDAWVGHPHVVVAPNLPNHSFEDKINVIIHSVKNMVGEQLQKITNHKLLIKKPKFPQKLKYEQSTIQQTYLINNEPECKQNKLKMRGSNGSNIYYQAYIFKTSHPDYTQELKKQLVPKQYMAMRQNMMDRNFQSVKRSRIDFIWNNFSYCIDIYDHVAGESKVYLLRFYAKKQQNGEFIPPFIQVIRDVRNEKQYKLRQIARKDKKMTQLSQIKEINGQI